MRNIFAEVVFSKVDTDNNFCRNPFKSYPQIFQTASGKSLAALSWSHYAALLQVNDPVARACGMSRKQPSRHGASAPCSGIYLRH